MPTKKKRLNIVPDNLPSVLPPPEETCPSLYTASKLSKDPVRYSLVVQALSEGKPLTRIAKEMKISPDTVAAVMKREKSTIDAAQDMIAGLATYAAQSCLMELIDALSKGEIPKNVLPIATGICIDKSRLLEDKSTENIHVKKTITLDQVKADLEEMKAEALKDETPESAG